jgi:hypothetical protein
MPEQVTERYLEIRATQSQDVICVVEVLSPKNKRPGAGRTVYEAKRQQVLGSATHFVEINLLRAGEPLPILGDVAPGYRVMVSRSQDRPNVDLYTFTLQDRMPTIPVPLRPHEPEPTIELQQIFNEIYQRARFDLAIDYTQPIKPALSPEEQDWVAPILGSHV